jgi:putative transposase
VFRVRAIIWRLPQSEFPARARLRKYGCAACSASPFPQGARAVNTQLSYLQQGVAVCTTLQEIAWAIGAGGNRAYEVYLTNERKLAPGSVLIAVAALRFLYKISLVDIDNGRVQFHWKDYRDNSESNVMDLKADELIRRFLLHVLPEGFQRIRYYGFLANRDRRKSAPCVASCSGCRPYPKQLRSRIIANMIKNSPAGR